MVVRRSTTLVTWPRARNSSLRSITSFMTRASVCVQARDLPPVRTLSPRQTPGEVNARTTGSLGESLLLELEPAFVHLQEPPDHAGPPMRAAGQVPANTPGLPAREPMLAGLENVI
jgi:hypothetical protein